MAGRKSFNAQSAEGFSCSLHFKVRSGLHARLLVQHAFAGGGARATPESAVSPDVQLLPDVRGAGVFDLSKHLEGAFRILAGLPVIRAQSSKRTT
jgi:hypothetical protein